MNLWMGNDPISRLTRIKRVRKLRRALPSRRPRWVIEVATRTTPEVLASGAIAGSAAMFYFDPVSGRRRRALVRDKSAHFARKTVHGLDAARRDLAHRMRGMAAEAQGKLQPEEVDDDLLVQRVRTALGRVVSHPHALDVRVHDGAVELSGPILRREVRRAVSHARKVRGVKRVEERFEAYEHPEGVPALQGGKLRRDRFELLQEYWTPGPRLVAGMIGAAMVGTAATTRFAPIRWPLGISGAALVARSATNKPAKTLFGRLERPEPAPEPEVQAEMAESETAPPGVQST